MVGGLGVGCLSELGFSGRLPELGFGAHSLRPVLAGASHPTPFLLAAFGAKP